MKRPVVASNTPVAAKAGSKASEQAQANSTKSQSETTPPSTEGMLHPFYTYQRDRHRLKKVRPRLKHHYDTDADNAFYTCPTNINTLLPAGVSGRVLSEQLPSVDKTHRAHKIGSVPIPPRTALMLGDLFSSELQALDNPQSGDKWVAQFLAEAFSLWKGSNPPVTATAHALECRERLLQAFKIPFGNTAELPKCPAQTARCVTMFNKAFPNFIGPIFVATYGEVNNTVRDLAQIAELPLTQPKPSCLNPEVIARKLWMIKYLSEMSKFGIIDLVAMMQMTQRIVDTLFTCLEYLDDEDYEVPPPANAAGRPKHQYTYAYLAMQFSARMLITMMKELGPFVLRDWVNLKDSNPRYRMSSTLDELDEAVMWTLADAEGGSPDGEERLASDFPEFIRVRLLHAIDTLTAVIDKKDAPPPVPTTILDHEELALALKKYRAAGGKPTTGNPLSSAVKGAVEAPSSAAASVAPTPTKAAATEVVQTKLVSTLAAKAPAATITAATSKVASLTQPSKAPPPKLILKRKDALGAADSGNVTATGTPTAPTAPSMPTAPKPVTANVPPTPAAVDDVVVDYKAAATKNRPLPKPVCDSESEAAEEEEEYYDDEEYEEKEWYGEEEEYGEEEADEGDFHTVASSAPQSGASAVSHQPRPAAINTTDSSVTTAKSAAAVLTNKNNNSSTTTNPLEKLVPKFVLEPHVSPPTSPPAHFSVTSSPQPRAALPTYNAAMEQKISESPHLRMAANAKPFQTQMWGALPPPEMAGGGDGAYALTHNAVVGGVSGGGVSPMMLHHHGHTPLLGSTSSANGSRMMGGVGPALGGSTSNGTMMPIGASINNTNNAVPDPMAAIASSTSHVSLEAAVISKSVEESLDKECLDDLAKVFEALTSGGSSPRGVPDIGMDFMANNGGSSDTGAVAGSGSPSAAMTREPTTSIFGGAAPAPATNTNGMARNSSMFGEVGTPVSSTPAGVVGGPVAAAGGGAFPSSPLPANSASATSPAPLAAAVTPATAPPTATKVAAASTPVQSTPTAQKGPVMPVASPTPTGATPAKSGAPTPASVTSPTTAAKPSIAPSTAATTTNVNSTTSTPIAAGKGASAATATASAATATASAATANKSQQLFLGTYIYLHNDCYNSNTTPMEQLLRWLLFDYLSEASLPVVVSTVRRLVGITLSIATAADKKDPAVTTTPYSIQRNHSTGAVRYPLLKEQDCIKALTKPKELVADFTSAAATDVESMDLYAGTPEHEHIGPAAAVAAATKHFQYLSALAAHFVASNSHRFLAGASSSTPTSPTAPNAASSTPAISFVNTALALLGQVLRNAQAMQFDKMHLLAEVVSKVSMLKIVEPRGHTAPSESPFLAQQMTEGVVYAIRMSLRADLTTMANAYHLERQEAATGSCSKVSLPVVDSQAVIADLRFYAELCRVGLVGFDDIMTLLQEILLYYPNTTADGATIEVSGRDYSGEMDAKVAANTAWVSRKQAGRLASNADTSAGAKLFNYFIANSGQHDVSRIRFVCAVLEAIAPSIVIGNATTTTRDKSVMALYGGGFNAFPSLLPYAASADNDQQAAAKKGASTAAVTAALPALPVSITPADAQALEAFLARLCILIHAKQVAGSHNLAAATEKKNQAHHGADQTNVSRFLNDEGATLLPFDLEAKVIDVFKVLSTTLYANTPSTAKAAAHRMQKNTFPANAAEAQLRLNTLLKPVAAVSSAGVAAAGGVVGGVELQLRALSLLLEMMACEEYIGKLMAAANNGKSPFPIAFRDALEHALGELGLGAYDQAAEERRELGRAGAALLAANNAVQPAVVTTPITPTPDEVAEADTTPSSAAPKLLKKKDKGDVPFPQAAAAAAAEKVAVAEEPAPVRQDAREVVKPTTPAATTPAKTPTQPTPAATTKPASPTPATQAPAKQQPAKAPATSKAAPAAATKAAPIPAAAAKTIVSGLKNPTSPAALLALKIADIAEVHPDAIKPLNSKAYIETYNALLTKVPGPNNATREAAIGIGEKALKALNKSNFEVALKESTDAMTNDRDHPRYVFYACKALMGLKRHADALAVFEQFQRHYDMPSEADEKLFAMTIRSSIQHCKDKFTKSITSMIAISLQLVHAGAYGYVEAWAEEELDEDEESGNRLLSDETRAVERLLRDTMRKADKSHGLGKKHKQASGMINPADEKAASASKQSSSPTPAAASTPTPSTPATGKSAATAPVPAPAPSASKQQQSQPAPTPAAKTAAAPAHIDPTSPAPKSANNTPDPRAEAFKNQGNDAYGKDDLRTAIDMYSNAINIDPHQAAYYGNRAVCYKKQNKHKKVYEDAGMALSLNNTRYKFAVLLIEAAVSLEKHTEAIGVFETFCDRVDDMSEEEVTRLHTVLLPSVRVVLKRGEAAFGSVLNTVTELSNARAIQFAVALIEVALRHDERAKTLEDDDHHQLLYQRDRFRVMCLPFISKGSKLNPVQELIAMGLQKTRPAIPIAGTTTAGTAEVVKVVVADPNSHLPIGGPAANASAHRFVGLSRDALRNNSPAIALKLLNNAIKMEQHASYYLLRAYAHFKDSSFTEALADAEEALQRNDDNDHMALLEVRILAYTGLEKFHSALGEFDKFVSDNNDALNWGLLEDSGEAVATALAFCVKRVADKASKTVDTLIGEIRALCDAGAEATAKGLLETGKQWIDECGLMGTMQMHAAMTATAPYCKRLGVKTPDWFMAASVPSAEHVPYSVLNNLGETLLLGGHFVVAERFFKGAIRELDVLVGLGGTVGVSPSTAAETTITASAQAVSKAGTNSSVSNGVLKTTIKFRSRYLNNVARANLALGKLAEAESAAKDSTFFMDKGILPTVITARVEEQRGELAKALGLLDIRVFGKDGFPDFEDDNVYHAFRNCTSDLLIRCFMGTPATPMNAERLCSMAESLFASGAYCVALALADALVSTPPTPLKNMCKVTDRVQHKRMSELYDLCADKVYDFAYKDDAFEYSDYAKAVIYFAIVAKPAALPTKIAYNAEC